MEDKKNESNRENEQQVQFERMVEAIGSETLAIFCCCVCYDVPFVPKCVPTFGETDIWIKYIKAIGIQKYNQLREKGFLGGDTDVLRVFGDSADPEEITEIIAQERAKHPATSDTKLVEQIKTWGTGSPENPLSKGDYERLDYFYDTLTARLRAAGGVDLQQELILRKVAEFYLGEEKCRAEGNVSDAQKFVKMALDLLSSEQLQKKDAKPVEELRIDSIVDALEKWGAIENGKILSFPELTEFLLKQLGRLGGTPSHKYAQTLDAADWELFFIQNCMAQNEDLPKWMEMPDNMRFGEEVANEFADAPSDDEKRAYEGIGILKSRPAKRGRKKKGES